MLQDVPQWFDEGQAVLISQAKEFSDAAWRDTTANCKDAPPLSLLATMEDWNRLTGTQGEYMQFTYGTARREVERWGGLANLQMPTHGLGKTGTWLQHSPQMTSKVRDHSKRPYPT